MATDTRPRTLQLRPETPWGIGQSQHRTFVFGVIPYNDIMLISYRYHKLIKLSQPSLEGCSSQLESHRRTPDLRNRVLFVGCIRCGAKPGFADDSCYCSSLFRPVESSGGQIRIPRPKLQHQDPKSSKSKHVLHMQTVSRSRAPARN